MGIKAMVTAHVMFCLTDPITDCPLEYGVLAAARAAELLDLQRQGQPISLVEHAPIAPGHSGTANVHTIHVRQATVKHMTMYNVKAFRKPLFRKSWGVCTVKIGK
jgi:hypothetical protein